MSDEINDPKPDGEQVTSPKQTRSRAVVKRNEVVEGEIVGSGTMVMTPDEYAAYSKANGRIMGREQGQKTVMTPEEFVVLSKDGWSPKKMMEKHGIDLKELQEVASRVALIMQLKRPIQVTETQVKW